MTIRFLGTPVRFTSQALFLIFLLLLWGYTGSWLNAFIFMSLGILCLLLHERAHVAMGAKYGIKCHGIDVMFMGLGAKLENTGKTARQAFWVAVAGPLSSALLGGLSLGLAVLTNDAVRDLFALLTYFNFMLAIFNALPLYPMDGGRVAHAICWFFKKDEQKGRIMAVKLSKISILIILLAVLYGALVGFLSWFSLMWLGFIFSFMWRVADAEVAMGKLADKKFKYGQKVFIKNTTESYLGSGTVVNYKEMPKNKYVVKVVTITGKWTQKTEYREYFEHELESFEILE